MLKRVKLCFISCLMLSAPVMAEVTFAPAFPNIGFSFPTEIQNARDGSNRLFVVEQAGTIKVFPNTRNVGPTQVSTFLDIRDRVAFSTGQETGLLGLAFHPNFENNNLFYVYYTASNNGIFRQTVEQFSANGNSASRNSGRVIMQFDKNQRNSNHNGGKIGFGPDGYLYASLGDGGGGGDPQRNSQNLNSAFGKLLRIDVDLDGSNPTSADGRYEIPSDNPFMGRSGLDIIYAYGLRNMWKFAFDNSTGRLWGADVGQSSSRAREEINLIENGGNYGWSRFQDDVIWNDDVPNQANMRSAIFSYDHSRGDRSITGGYVYRGGNIGSTNPDINNKYIYGDFVTGRVWALDYNENTGRSNSTLLFRTNGQSVSSFGEDEDRNLYFSDYGAQDAQLYALVDSDVGVVPPPAPTPTAVIPPLTLPNASWLQFSLPCDPGNINTVDELFGDDNLGDYGSDWIIWAFDGANNVYQNVNEQTAIEPGQGYWIRQQTGGTRQLDVPSSCTAPPKTASADCPAANGCFAAPLADPAAGNGQTVQYQMVGYPFAYAGPVSDTYVSTESGTCGNGCAIGSAEANGIIEPVLFNFNGTSYDLVTPSDQHSPWLGYWVQVMQSAEGDGVQILFGQSPP